MQFAQNKIVKIISNTCLFIFQTAFYDSCLLAMLEILAFLNKINHSIEGLKVPYDTFHMNDLSEYLDVRVDYVYWLSDQGVRL